MDRLQRNPNFAAFLAREVMHLMLGVKEVQVLIQLLRLQEMVSESLEVSAPGAGRVCLLPRMDG